MAKDNVLCDKCKHRSIVVTADGCTMVCLYHGTVGYDVKECKDYEPKEKIYCIMLKRCYEWYIKDFEYEFMGPGVPEDITITSQRFKAKKYNSIEDAERDRRNIEFLYDYPFKDRLVTKEY